MRRLTLLLALPLAAGVAYSNDLARYYELAMSRDTILQAAQFQRDALVEARPQALARWLPQLIGSTSVVRERVGLDSGDALGGTAADCVMAATTGRQHCAATSRALGLNLSQTLWSFQSFSALKEANFQVAAAESALQNARQNLLLRVAQAYFGILSARDQLHANEGEREAFGKLLSQARNRLVTGVGPRSDVEQAQAFSDATEQTVIDAHNALDDAMLLLGEIVGSEVDSVASLRDEIPLVPPEPAGVEDWVNSARTENFDVRTSLLNQEAAEQDIGVQRGRGLPSLALVASTSKLAQDAVLGGNQRLDTIGVTFDWPLFQGGAIASAVRQSRALLHQAQALVDGAQREAERRTRIAYRGVETGIQRIRAAHRAVGSGRDAVDAMHRNVEFGTGTEFELLDAQTNYFNAVRAYDQARYDYLTNLLTLKQLAGQLTVRDLDAVDALLVGESR